MTRHVLMVMALLSCVALARSSLLRFVVVCRFVFVRFLFSFPPLARSVYDITNRESFENIQHWLKEIDIYSTNDECVKLLIANKIDDGANRTVSKKEGLAFAREHNMLFIEASAKTQDGINQAFDEVIQKILDVPALLVDDHNAAGAGSGSSSSGGAMRLERDDGQQRGGSCGGFCA